MAVNHSWGSRLKTPWMGGSSSSNLKGYGFAGHSFGVYIDMGWCILILDAVGTVSKRINIWQQRIIPLQAQSQPGHLVSGLDCRESC